MNRKIAFCLIFLLAFTSCKKKTIQFTLKGKVNDTSFDNGLSGATLTFYKVPVASTTKVNLGSTTTDSDGNYSFSFDRDQSEKYYIECTKNQYYGAEKLIYFSDLKTDGDNVYNMDMEAQATVTWVLKNQLPTHPEDLMKIQKLDGKTDCDACCANTFYIYPGENVDTSLTCMAKGNEWLHFYVIYFDSSYQYSHKDSVYCTAFQTTTYPLNY